MELIDYIIIGVAAVAVIGIIAHLVYRKKKGKGGCGCGCAGCSNFTCPSAKKQEQTKEEENNA